MTTPNQESLRDLSREELIELILQQAEAIRQMQTEIEQLKKPTTASRRATRRSRRRGIGSRIVRLGSETSAAGRNLGMPRLNVRWWTSQTR